MNTCAQAEQAILREVLAGEPQEGELQEAVRWLLDELLETLGHLGPGATDGVDISLQEVSPSSLWALGTAYLFTQPDKEPVWVDLAFDPAHHAITSGQVLFGIRDSALLGIRRTKLENRLLGFPHETKGTVLWRHAFRRGVSGWGTVEWQS